VPDLEKVYRTFSSNECTNPNRENLRAVAADPVQQDYQWLCNAVHPKAWVGCLLFAAPMMAHNTKTCAYQWVCAVSRRPSVRFEGGHVLKDANLIAPAIKPDAREATIQNRPGKIGHNWQLTFLRKRSMGALKIIDDIGLTTKAPKDGKF